MKNNILNLAIVLTVGVILAGSLLMPVISDATKTTETFTNDGYYRMSELAENDTVVIEWNPTTATTASTIEINDVEFDLAESTPNFASRSLAFSEDLILRFYNDATSFSIQLWNSAFITGVSSTNATLTVTINNGVLSWNNGTNTTEYSYTGDMIVINPTEGDMIMKKSTDTSYLLHDSSIIYGGGISVLAGSTYTGIYMSGTVDSITDESINVMNSNATVSDTEVVYTEVDGYIDLVSFEKITFKTTYSDTTTNQTYSYVVVPYKVTAELSQHLAPGEITLINIIPVMVIVALLMVAVGGLYLRRND